MGCWQVPAKGSSCQRPVRLCRCLRPTCRRYSAPRPSWRGWPGSMWACVRVAQWVVCASRGGAGGSLGACLGPPVHSCPSAGAAVTAWRGATDQRQFAGPFDAGRGVRAWIVQGRAAHSLGRAMDAKPIAQINTRGKSPVIICACTRAQTLQTPLSPTCPSSGLRFSPTRFIRHV